MGYTTEATFQYEFPHRDVSVWPGSSEFTQLIARYDAEINKFVRESGGITDTYTDVITVENNLIEQHLNYVEEIRLTPPGERAGRLPPTLFSAENAPLRQKLQADRALNKPQAANYNLVNKKIRW